MYTHAMVIQSAYSLTSQNWKELLLAEGQSPHVLPFWLDGLYKDQTLWERHISPKLVENLKNQLDFRRPEISTIQTSEDGTIKFLVRLQDNMEVETVLIPFHKRYTICLSTQVGCAMNCSFCYTGTQGLKRNLKSHEIVGQYQLAFDWLKTRNDKELTPGIVFMGQGEPLHNVDEVKQAIKILNDPKLFGVGHRQMTLSTVGYLPGIQKLKDFPQINFALSLHSPFEEERVKLIPINERFPLKDVIKALDEIPLLKRQFITYEYLLIQNLNMTEAHADALEELLRDRPAILNLIPFNPFPGSHWERPTLSTINEFKEMLVERKLRVMVRTTKGDDILAACGQLKVNKLARKNGV